MFAIFAATIAAILTQPLPSGAVMLIALCVVIFTKTLPEAKALSGFASGTVWLIFCAYVLSLGFVTSGLGNVLRIKCYRSLVAAARVSLTHWGFRSDYGPGNAISNRAFRGLFSYHSFHQ